MLALTLFFVAGCYATAVGSQQSINNRDFIPVLEDGSGAHFLMLRRSDIVYNIIGSSVRDHNYITERIKSLALELKIGHQRGKNANLNIVIEDSIFRNGIFIEGEASNFGIPMDVLDRLRARWRVSHNCVFANDHWNTTELGISLILISNSANSSEKKQCIDKAIAESSGINIDRFVSCLKNCFDTPVTYNLSLAISSIKTCDLQLNSDRFDSNFKDLFSSCFWPLYRSVVK